MKHIQKFIKSTAKFSTDCPNDNEDKKEKRASQLHRNAIVIFAFQLKEAPKHYKNQKIWRIWIMVW